MDIDPFMTRSMKTFMRVPRYGTACGRIMMRESTFLNWQRIERVLESDFDEGLKVLLETESGKYLAGSRVAADVERGLLNFLANEYRFLDEICAGTYTAAFMHLKYDFHNLKTLFKLRISSREEEVEDILLPELGSVDVEEMRLSIEKRRKGFLPPLMEEAIERVWKALDVHGETPQRVDAQADRIFLEKRLEISGKEKSRFLINFSRASIDLANLRVLLRGMASGKDEQFFRESLASGGKIPVRTLIELSRESQDRVSSRLLSSRYGRVLAPVLEASDRRARLSSLDRQSDEYLMEHCAAMSRVAVGPERIVRYMIRRENEVVLLRIILMGKLHGLSPQAIEERITAVCGRAGF